MTFNDLNLNKPILKALAEMNLVTPTVIQERGFPVIMSGRDVVGIAQTGTGKTLAYLLPCLRQMEYSKDKLPRLLILVPTRELVMQVVTEIEKLIAYLNLTVHGVYGGKNIKTQIQELAVGHDIIVGTPGRLLDLMLNGSVKVKAIKKLVIDEVDEMLDLGFRAQINRVLDLIPSKRQNLMFSATLTEDVEILLKTFFHNPEKIEAAPTGTPLDQIEQLGYFVPNFYTKINLLKFLLDENQSFKKVLVFTASKKMADQVLENMTDYDDAIAVIHSNKSQNTRFNTVNNFHAGKLRILVATDLISRGLDITDVTHVINFDMPELQETYIHRIGRTGRADKKGIAISFITDSEKAKLLEIETFMHTEIRIASLPEDVELSDILTEEEDPRTETSNIQLKLPDIDDRGPAFHEKKEKNKKVNNKISHSTIMMKKYGKPKTRGQKKPRKK